MAVMQQGQQQGPCPLMHHQNPRLRNCTSWPQLPATMQQSTHRSTRQLGSSKTYARHLRRAKRSPHSALSKTTFADTRTASAGARPSMLRRSSVMPLSSTFAFIEAIEHASCWRRRIPGDGGACTMIATVETHVCVQGLPPGHAACLASAEPRRGKTETGNTHECFGRGDNSGHEDFLAPHYCCC